jgi:hypothetical protein
MSVLLPGKSWTEKELFPLIDLLMLILYFCFDKPRRLPNNNGGDSKTLHRLYQGRSTGQAHDAGTKKQEETSC